VGGGLLHGPARSHTKRKALIFKGIKGLDELSELGEQEATLRKD
jgi:hypothetical protein